MTPYLVLTRAPIKCTDATKELRRQFEELVISFSQKEDVTPFLSYKRNLRESCSHQDQIVGTHFLSSSVVDRPRLDRRVSVDDEERQQS